jgi:hypothetical protein
MKGRMEMGRRDRPNGNEKRHEAQVSQFPAADATFLSALVCGKLFFFSFLPHFSI